MRIAILTVNRRVVGGIESYLQLVCRALLAEGHQLALVYQRDAPEERPAVVPVEAVDSLPVSSQGAADGERWLRDWRPDLIYSHTLTDVNLEERLAATAPAIILAHCYIGTCISGSKTTKFPRPEPCARCFGLRCLLHYYPRRCGGWSPYSLGRLFGFEARRLALLHRYRSVLVASPHMAAEYTRHGLADRVSVIPLPIPVPEDEPTRPTWLDDTAHLLFLGRAEFLKGAHLLLDALPLVQTTLKRSLTLTIAGEGPALADWRRRAARITNLHPAITVRFTGWANEARKRELFRDSHLIVIPSIWPEPFGMVGLEAGHHGIPAAAFDVGGISSWLRPGMNGSLAPGHPPSAAGLSAAIVDCLRDPRTFGQLSQGAIEAPKSFTLARHLEQLRRVFERTVCAPSGCSTGLSSC